MERKLTYGMIGGGQRAFIGSVHRKAIRLDDSARLAAGSFSRDWDNNQKTGRLHDIEPDRIYRDYKKMAAAESLRPDPIDFAVIVTPNSTHFPIAKAFLEHGINVVCDKPMTITVEEADELKRIADKDDLLFAVTYTYVGYPAVKQARKMISRGDIGRILFVRAEYPQDGLANVLRDSNEKGKKEGDGGDSNYTEGDGGNSNYTEGDGGNAVSINSSKQFAWRTDPAQTGAASTLGDIGTHIEQLVAYMTGLTISSLSARIDSLVLTNGLDDNASILIEYEGGAKGQYWCSQVAWGFVNDLSIAVIGTKGSVRWSHSDPEALLVSIGQEPCRRLVRGRSHFEASSEAAYSRTPGGHPEGFIEAFANIYRSYTAALRKKLAGDVLSPADIDFPTVGDGAAGIRFIHAALESSRTRTWVSLE